MSVKREKNIKIFWGAFAIAFVFLFNPNVAIIDPLPDLIGYFILSLALSKVAMLSETLYDAKRSFERLIILDSGKLIAILWTFGIEAVSERETSLLLWSFVFGVLEALFAIPAYVKLFEGFTSLGNFYPNASILGRKGKKKKSYTDFLKSFSIFFVIFKATFTCLPELASLSASTYNDASVLSIFYRYINVVRLLCVLPVLIVGIAWLVSVFRYFFKISKDEPFVSAINEAYAEKKTVKTGYFVIKDIKIASAFMIIAAIFSIDFNLDGVNILPDIAVVIFLGIAAFYFAKTAKIKKAFVIVSFSVFAVFTLFEDFARYYFAENFYYNAINKNGEAFDFYIVTVVAAAIEGVLLVVVYLSMARAIKSVVAEHTGYVAGKEIRDEGEERQILTVRKELNKNFSRLSDVAILCALADTFVSLYGAFYAFLNKNLGWASLVSGACGLLLVGMTVRAVSELKEAVQIKYMLE